MVARRAPRGRKVASATGCTGQSLTRDNGAAEQLINDLAFGQLTDIGEAQKRILEVFDIAFEQGANAQAAATADKTQQLAAECRRLREKLVQTSLMASLAEAEGLIPNATLSNVPRDAA